MDDPAPIPSVHTLAGTLRRCSTVLLLASPLWASSARAEAIDSIDHYRTEVWARVVFGADGRTLSQQVVDEDRLPAAFADLVKQHLAAARVEPRSVDGRAATFSSGVRLQYEITRGSAGHGAGDSSAGSAGSTTGGSTGGRADGSARLAQVQVAPLPLKRYYAAFPRELRGPDNWDGGFTVTCQVSTDGVCSRIDVSTLPGMPPSIHRYAKASLERWTFEPQRVDDQPVTGEFVLKVSMHTIATKPEDFRLDKFDRIQLRR